MNTYFYLQHLIFQNFYKNEFDRKEMYLRYIYKLHDLHFSAENYTEAGFTMKLHADQLSWTNHTPVSDLNNANLTESQLKEKLYLQMIHYFDKGKVKIVIFSWLVYKLVWFLVLGRRYSSTERAGSCLRRTIFRLQSSK